jgi:hypothetical protein
MMCLHTHHLRDKIYHVVHENHCEEQIEVPPASDVEPSHPHEMNVKFRSKLQVNLIFWDKVPFLFL